MIPGASGPLLALELARLALAESAESAPLAARWRAAGPTSARADGSGSGPPDRSSARRADARRVAPPAPRPAHVRARSLARVLRRAAAGATAVRASVGAACVDR